MTSSFSLGIHQFCLATTFVGFAALSGCGSGQTDSTDFATGGTASSSGIGSSSGVGGRAVGTGATSTGGSGGVGGKPATGGSGATPSGGGTGATLATGGVGGTGGAGGRAGSSGTGAVTTTGGSGGSGGIASTGGSGAKSSSGGRTGSGGLGGLSGAGGASSGTAPTWATLYKNYLAQGTIGKCVSCHSFGSSSAGLYQELTSAGQISGTRSLIGVKGSSILKWLGGSMPQGPGITNAQAAADFQAWVAAGALQN